jgi:hypothetical protein
VWFGVLRALFDVLVGWLDSLFKAEATQNVQKAPQKLLVSQPKNVLLLSIELSQLFEIGVLEVLILASVALRRYEAHICYHLLHPMKLTLSALQYTLKRLNSCCRGNSNSGHQSNLFWAVVAEEAFFFFLEQFSEILDLNAVPNGG